LFEPCFGKKICLLNKQIWHPHTDVEGEALLYIKLSMLLPHFNHLLMTRNAPWKKNTGKNETASFCLHCYSAKINVAKSLIKSIIASNS
jgi:hypothetical protein